MEFLVLIALAGYIYYLRNYADLRSNAEKEAASLNEGIQLLKSGETADAFKYFDAKIRIQPKSPVALLHRAQCYVEMNEIDAARKDLSAGLSYDDSVFELHLETGKIYYNEQNFKEALLYLDKAIIKSGGKNAESYHWRGLTNEKLNLPQQAEQDFQAERNLSDMAENQSSQLFTPPRTHFDRRLLANSLLTILTTCLLLWMIKNAESIHLPYLVAVAASMSLGFVEPYKGWMLALLQGALLWLGYTFLCPEPESGGQQELENFSLYGSIVLTFAGSFLGAFLKRAISG